MESWRPFRRPTQMRITLSALGRRMDVSLLDVSESGMKLTYPDLLPTDALVEVSTPRIARTGRVRWSRQGALGVTLTEPLSLAEQAELAGMSWGY
ncbi:PilZ domain-containing protein [Jannaschia seohaensis]|uniref:PilZ domain-containing protein n=2 Tax=Jannaschia seohaensis TaxID=475081 RepID=A0A2Y9APP9_9RHOB|nr:PilZ domain-containing protein [Jannaschia seohaensis]PWJ20363.1 PilZ domain-containing protein [Jannaschia seohaensis]SSA44417.1 PilZ domain-containing protein [Jannaschia seohaensis]